LSGSDDGCVALWNVLKKKPVMIVKNAHGRVEQDNGKESSNYSQVSVICNGMLVNPV
jgi:ribosomal RNA-processing protein 9